MPHFIIDCSENLFSNQDVDTIHENVHKAAQSTGLFGDGANIQVRLNPYQNWFMAGKKVDAIHVFARILEGRTKEQKLDLSKTVIKTLAEMFPEVETIAMDVINLDKGVGFNKNKL